MPQNLKPARGVKSYSLERRVGELERERARLEEEVLQLKAAVDIWTEVFRQTAGGGKPPTFGGLEAN